MPDERQAGNGQGDQLAAPQFGEAGVRGDDRDAEACDHRLLDRLVRPCVDDLERTSAADALQEPLHQIARARAWFARQEALAEKVFRLEIRDRLPGDGGAARS